MTTVLISLAGSGILVNMATGNPIAMCSLNWIGYSAGYEVRPWWTYLIEYFVVLFPTFEVFSCYPIVNIIMSDNILGLYGANEKESIPYSTYILWRSVCWSVPFLISFVFYDLSGILNWSGLLFILMTYIGVPLLFLATRKVIPGHSHYSSPLTSRTMAYFGLTVAVISWIYCAIILMQQAISPA